MVDFARASGKEKAPCCHRDLHVNSHEHDVRIFFVRSASGVERKEGRKEGRKEAGKDRVRGSHSRNQQLPLRILWQMGREAYPP